MTHTNLFNDFVNWLDDFNTTFESLFSAENNNDKNSNDNFTYRTTYVRHDLKSADEQSEYLKKKLESWSFIATCISEPVDIKLTFDFDKNRLLTFIWDNDKKLFYTNHTDEDGSEILYYDPTKNVLTNEPKCDEPEQKEQNTKDTCECKEAEKTEEHENTDRNLAFNLKNKLTKKMEEENKAKGYICPKSLIEDFKTSVIDKECYETVYCENEPYEITWKLSDFDWSNEEFNQDVAESVYKNESYKLDDFCEQLKETYGFSVASWSTVGKPITDVEFRAIF